MSIGYNNIFTLPKLGKHLLNEASTSMLTFIQADNLHTKVVFLEGRNHIFYFCILGNSQAV